MNCFAGRGDPRQIGTHDRSIDILLSGVLPLGSVLADLEKDAHASNDSVVPIPASVAMQVWTVADITSNSCSMCLSYSVAVIA